MPLWRWGIKLWNKRDEWMQYAHCGGDSRYTAEALNPTDMRDVKDKCAGCEVRPECIQWALKEEVTSVVIAGVLLPDPSQKRLLKRIYQQFRETLPAEFEARGEDF